MERLVGVWIAPWCGADDTATVHAGLRLNEVLVDFCPFTTWVRAGFYVFPVRGPARLWGGEEGVLTAVRALVVDTTGLVPALGVAEGHWLTQLAAQSGTRVAPAAIATYRRQLPIAVLLDHAHAELAHRLGLHTVGAFADLPASRVLERFSKTVVRQHEVAQGRRDEEVGDHAFAAHVRRVRGESAEPVGQLGFFGDRGERDRRADRVQHRLAALLGPDAVVTAERVGGRTPEACARWRPWGDGTTTAPDDGPWPGGLPAPWPVVTCQTPTTVHVADATGEPVRVTRRGMVSAELATVNLTGRDRRTVVWWAGPWLEDESWWSPRPRRAHVQVVLVGDLALWLYASGTAWWLAGVYD
jgi:hypothetical protein